MAEDRRFVRAPAALARRSLDGIVVLPAESDEPVLVGGSSAVLWDLLDEPRSIDELAGALSGIYDAPFETLASDIVGVLGALADAGVVRPCP